VGHGFGHPLGEGAAALVQVEVVRYVEVVGEVKVRPAIAVKVTSQQTER